MNDIREELKAFLDGELDTIRAAEVQAAIEADPQLQKEVELMKMLGFEIKRLAAEPAIQGRAEAIQTAKGRGGGFNLGRWYRSLSPGMATFVAILVIGSVAGVFIGIVSPAVRGGFSQSEAASTGAMALKSQAPAAAGESYAGKDSEFVDGKYGLTTGGTTGGFGGAGGGPTGGAMPPVRGRAEAENYRADQGVAVEDKAKANAPSVSPSTPRMVIKTADLSLRVENVKKSFDDATKLTAAMGGFVTTSNSTGIPGENPTASMTMRIPSARFESMMSKLRAYGEVLGDSSDGQDVTAEYVDTTARIKIMKAEEDSLATMLRAARKVGEMLEIKERLMRLRSEIEGLEAQARTLKDQSSLSTITLNLEQKSKIGAPTKPADPFSDAWVSAVNGLRGSLQAIGVFFIGVFVYAPFWLPVLIVSALGLRKLRKVLDV